MFIAFNDFVAGHQDRMAAEEAIAAAGEFFDPFGEAMKASKRTMKRREQRKRKKNKMFAVVSPQVSASMNSLGCISYTTPDYGQANTAQKKGKPMCYDCDCRDDESTVENRKLTYVQNRISSLEYSKRNELRKMFKLDDDVAPTNAKDLLERLESKQYQLRSDEEMRATNMYYGYGALSGFRWRAPDSKPDQAGYDAAETEMSKFARSVELKATVGDAAMQIEAVQSLVDWQPSNKPN